MTTAIPIDSTISDRDRLIADRVALDEQLATDLIPLDNARDEAAAEVSEAWEAYQAATTKLSRANLSRSARIISADVQRDDLDRQLRAMMPAAISAFRTKMDALLEDTRALETMNRTEIREDGRGGRFEVCIASSRPSQMRRLEAVAEARRDADLLALTIPDADLDKVLAERLGSLPRVEVEPVHAKG